MLHFLSLIILSFLLGVLAKTKKLSTQEKFLEYSFVTPKTFNTQLKFQQKVQGVTALLHYISDDSENKKYLTNVFSPLAQELKGIVRLFAMDCGKWQEYCKNNHNLDLKTPSVIIYPPDIIKPPQILISSPNAKTIKATAFNYVPSQYVKVINENNLDSFMNKNKAIPRILLYSNKNSTPVLLKALSCAFVDRIHFGVVHANETNIAKTYGIKKIPSLTIFLQNSNKPQIYKGDINYLDIYNWINPHAETFVKGGGFSSIKATTTSKNRILEKIPEITKNSYKTICAIKDKGLCLMYLSDGSPPTHEIEMLESLAEEFTLIPESVKFRWGWLDIQVEKNFANLFGINEIKLPSIVALNPHKRLRYAQLMSNQTADSSTIKNFLTKIISGDGKFIIIKEQKLPDFAVRGSKKEEL